MLAGCTVRYDVTDGSVVRGQQLSPCSIEGTPFASLPFDEWADTYHQTVSTVVEEFFGQQESAEVIDCTTINQGDGSPVAVAGSALETLARTLAPWADGQTPVTRLMTGDVLRTYLDAYLCSLHEQYFTLALSAQPSSSEAASTSKSQNSSLETIDLGDFADWVQEDRTLIERELKTAGPAMERTLTLMSADERTIGLKTILKCLLRSSTDLRNAFGLLSEASACVGRIWDTTAILRDEAASLPSENE